jgi:serine/threonine protein kinase
MAKDLARGLAYLHSQAIIHGDIHPKHIGITHQHQAKWTDFGLAKVRAAGIATLPRVSDEAAWQAPESWQNRTALSTASDVYSFGMLLWTLISGKFPYAQMSATSVIQHVQQGKRETLSTLPQALRELIAACWHSDANARPSAQQITRSLASMEIHQFRPASPTAEEYYERGVKAQQAGNMPEAYQDYQRSAQKDYFKAYTRVGLFALQGLGGAVRDKAQAETNFKTAASRGHADAMFNLGRMYEKGDTVDGHTDDVKALTWYERARNADPDHPRYQEKVVTLTQRVQSSEMNAVTQRFIRK